MPRKFSGWLKFAVLVILIAAIAVGFFERQAISDWVKLYNYKPPAAVAKLAADDTMTPLARHYLNLNKPRLDDKASFRQNCPSGGEQTIVLGCYHSGENGIYLLKVDDPRLDGVEQVTAAHEMLHATYERLGSSERNQVDAWLLAYYKTLTDPRLIQTFNAYKKSEPGKGQLVDEMHSIFGTEVANLPANLENYYKRYFTDRAKITGYAANYQGTFVEYKEQLTAYDDQLTQLKSRIGSDEASASTLATKLKLEQNQLAQYQAAGDASGYNSLAASYNADVDSYNSLAASLETEINQYNQIVAERNQLAVTVNNLGQELNASVQTLKPAGS